MWFYKGIEYFLLVLIYCMVPCPTNQGYPLAYAQSPEFWEANKPYQDVERDFTVPIVPEVYPVYPNQNPFSFTESPDPYQSLDYGGDPYEMPQRYEYEDQFTEKDWEWIGRNPYD